VVAAYSPRDLRLKHLAEQIEDSRGSSNRATWAYQPEALIERDENEEQSGGQDVSGTFHRADFFIRGWGRDVINTDVVRMLEILFGSPFRTPTRDEHSMFLAAGAGLRSAELGRQVGAAIAARDGSVLALGSNEVPKAGGGSHWEEDGVGNRDFEIGDTDTNRHHLDELAESLAVRVDDHIRGLAADLGSSAATERLQEQLRNSLARELRAGGLKDLTEFGRAVHAEMNALLDAARRGVPVADSVLYCTTFPCHNCGRHIIGAGVLRVVFIEPYGKSRTEELHGESVRISQSPTPDGEPLRVRFEPFVGVAPRRYLELFDFAARERLGHLGRKDPDGRKREFAKTEARPVSVDAGLPEFTPAMREYRAKELIALAYFESHVDQADTSGP
jgi:cytidine deaminase